ncbi:MAG: GNAT family N-acetyltransferase [Ilumatobacteraceae bacterium]|nr:GNAT family N-acetyltransferase [Ilumatobacteraceae bacterium]
MAPGSQLTVRRAVADDWPAIWAIFRAVVAGGDTYAYPADIDEDAARTVWLHLDEGRTVTFVAEADGAVVGTALLKPNLPGLGDHVANAGWMVDPERAGQGIGRVFALGVIQEARELGFRAMQFNAVVATNERALALWRSLGFAVVGTIPAAFRHSAEGETDLCIMYRSL